MQRSNSIVDASMWISAIKSVVGLGKVFIVDMSVCVRCVCAFIYLLFCTCTTPSGPFQYFKISFWETLTDPHFLRWFANFAYNSAFVSDNENQHFHLEMLNFTNWAIDDIVSTVKTEGLTKEVGLVHTGALKLYFDAARFEAVKKHKRWEPVLDGEDTSILSREEVLALEPCVGNMTEEGAPGQGSAQLVGGALQRSAASGSCQGFMTGVMQILRSKHKDSFHVENNISVVGFETRQGAITQVHTSRGTLNVPDGCHVVVAAGSWTPLILRKLSLYCPVYPMKGIPHIYDARMHQLFSHPC